MVKRRTRKQKEGAKHQFTLSWEPNSVKEKSRLKSPQKSKLVKGQTKKRALGIKSSHPRREYTNNTGKRYNLASIRKDLLKSLSIASLILSLEVVIYLIGR